MTGPDYWLDAKRFNQDEARLLMEAVAAVRKRLRYSNADLYAEVRVFHQEHNDQYRDFIEKFPRREVEIVEDRRDFSGFCTQKIKNIKHQGTKKTIPGYLCWLCKNDPDQAKLFYERIGFVFRPYDQTALEPTGRSPMTIVGAAT